MRMRNTNIPYIGLTALLVLSQILSGCSAQAPTAALPTETATPLPLPSNTPIPTSPSPTPTEIPFFLEASVFSAETQVPILIYHLFKPDHIGPTTSMRIQLSEYNNQLQVLYDNGFSLVSLYEWINGTWSVPLGRRPLILTIDDLWAANQLFIDESGQPSPYSGLGILYEFAQSHPDFGYHAAVFAVNGDKFYAETQIDDLFYLADDISWTTPSWRIKLGETIAWALEHGIEVYNHSLNHPNLSNVADEEIQRQFKENDLILRDFLREAGRADLIPSLENIIALPEGKWPESYSGQQVILNYENTEGKPIMAVMEAYNLDKVQFTPSAFSPDFNPFAIPRITASSNFVNYIVEQKENIPVAQACQLGPLDETLAADADTLSELVQTAVATGACPAGVYHVSGYIFLAQDSTVSVHTRP